MAVAVLDDGDHRYRAHDAEPEQHDEHGKDGVDAAHVVGEHHHDERRGREPGEVERQGQEEAADETLEQHVEAAEQARRHVGAATEAAHRMRYWLLDLVRRKIPMKHPTSSPDNLLTVRNHFGQARASLIAAEMQGDARGTPRQTTGYGSASHWN